MNKTERFRALVAGQGGGPVLYHPIMMHFAARFHGIGYGAFASDYRKLVESNVRCMEHFGYDAVSVISDPFRETAAFGGNVEFPADAVPICREHIVKTDDDISALPHPDVAASPRTRDRIRGVAYYRELIGDSMPVIGWVEGPLAEACDLAGVGDILLNMALAPDFVKRLMDRVMPVAVEFARLQIEAGSDVMGIGDAICSQISPDMYREFVFPLHCELFERIHSFGAVVKLHICGNITHILPQLVKTGADIIDIDSMVDMDTAFESAGDTVALSGNLNPVAVIRDLPAAEVYEASVDLARYYAGRKFILSGGCEITVDTPHENVSAMMRAARGITYAK